jgi:hypothetical protein
MGFMIFIHADDLTDTLSDVTNQPTIVLAIPVSTAEHKRCHSIKIFLGKATPRKTALTVLSSCRASFRRRYDKFTSHKNRIGEYLYK